MIDPDALPVKDAIDGIRHRLDQCPPSLTYIFMLKEWAETLLARLAQLTEELDGARKRAQRPSKEWETVCGECDGSGWSTR